jgi:hypothetical protein
MKRVIDGKVYNTETAVLLHEWYNGHNSSDFNYCEEYLYKTKNGAYFIAGEGGAYSSYASRCGNSSGYGSGMSVLSKGDAIEWLEKHDGDDVITEQFGADVEEG